MLHIFISALVLYSIIQAANADDSKDWEDEENFPYDKRLAADLSSVLYPKIENTIHNEFQAYKRLLIEGTTEETEGNSNMIASRELAAGDPTSMPTSSPTSASIIQVSDNVVCVACKNLDHCRILNGFMVQEVYYPDNPEFLGTCRVIEALATRLNGEIFGVGRTFRDTAQCRSIVMQYLCLFWGSNNTMYNNGCNALDEVNRPLKNKQIHTQTPPCRSFCVQIAEVCANDYSAFLNVCYDIQCPPTETQCTPDPYIGAQVVSAGIGCSMPFDKDPYATNGASLAIHISNSWFHIGLIVVVSTLFVCFASI